MNPLCMLFQDATQHLTQSDVLWKTALHTATSPNNTTCILWGPCRKTQSKPWSSSTQVAQGLYITVTSPMISPHFNHLSTEPEEACEVEASEAPPGLRIPTRAKVMGARVQLLPLWPPRLATLFTWLPHTGWWVPKLVCWYLPIMSHGKRSF